MSENEFKPRLGKGSRSARRERKYLHALLASAARSGFPRLKSSRRFDGSRIGRGSVAARMLGAGGRYTGLRARRAIIKTRLVRLGGKALAAAHAHLKYIQRDGVSREGDAGQLYSAGEDVADGKAFLERCVGDRHQFRLIVSAEDGAQYNDLKPLIRRFMARMEDDLGTHLDWIAADHLDTFHPHTHIMLRGKDDQDNNLVISPEYIKHGMRERLCGLLSIDLGPRTDLEIEVRLQREVDAERLTSIDRNLLRRMDPGRIVRPAGRDMASHAIQTGRLRKLEALGLAEHRAGGKWQLGENLEPVLRRMGERGDIIRTMQRELQAAGLQRGPAERAIHEDGLDQPVVGRIVARGLADETRGTHYVIVDAIDGRTHYIDIGKGERTEPLPEGGVVRIAPRSASVRDMDQRIAAISVDQGGIYSVELHRIADPGASDDFIEAHVRRLEAIRRRKGKLERLPEGTWLIPPKFLELAGQYETVQQREAPVEVRLVSPLPLERLPDHDGSTWLDRELVSPGGMIRNQGFGREVRSALAVRRTWLLEQGLATTDGTHITYRANMLAVLQRRELVRAAAAIKQETGREFCEVQPGFRVEGVVRRRFDLPSGRFALIEDGHEFSLVPWRPVLTRALERRVSGVVRGDGSISWTLGRERGLEI